MGVEIHLKPIAVNLKLSSVVRSDQKRKSKEKMKMFYINLCLVMVAYTAAKEETRISSGANRVQDKENLVPVERLVLRVTERSVKARGHEQALGPAQRVITKGYHRVPANQLEKLNAQLEKELRQKQAEKIVKKAEKYGRQDKEEAEARKKAGKH